MKPEVVIFGLDGATYTVLDDLVARGVMPALGKFMSEGARAKLLSTVPPLTPLAWTSLVTGQWPGRHGILGFMQYDGPQSESVQLTGSRQVTAERMWSAANRQGKRAGVLNFVAHQPAPKIDGWVVPGWVSWRWLKRLTHPADLIDRLKRDLAGFDVKRLAIDFEEERKAIVGAPVDEYHGWVGLHIDREQQWFDVMCHQMEKEPVEMVGIVFDGVDKLQHLLWPYLDPALAPEGDRTEYDRVREMALAYFKRIDDLLAETLRRCGDDCTILICSDHGFTASTEILYLNTFLSDMGWLTFKPDTQKVRDGAPELDGDFYGFSGFIPENTKAYALTASTNGIYINVRGKKNEHGILPEEYYGFREELKQALLSRCVDAEGNPLVTRVYTKEEIFQGPHYDNAPDLTLALRDFGFISVRRTDSYWSRRSQILGTHHPEGILIARGPGIRKNVEVETAEIIDVAPTALFAMNLSIPEDYQGRVLESLFEPEVVARREPKKAAAAAGAEFVEMPPDVPEEDLEIIEKMKALGYLE